MSTVPVDNTAARLKQSCTVMALLLVVVGVTSGSANAQSITGNLFVGAGAFVCCEGHADAWLLGAGADFSAADGIGLGGEVSGIGPVGEGVVPEPHGYATFGRASLVSFNGSYYFARQDSRPVRVFLKGGWGATFAHNDVTGGLNFGAGVDWWLRDRRGIRLELRDQLLEEFGTSHLVLVRVGLLVR